MVIGRGRRREHPQPTFYTTTKKKERKQNIREQNYGNKKDGKKYRETSTVGKK